MTLQPWTFWDYALFFGVLGMVTVLSATHAPKLKAVLLCIPLPFVLLMLAAGTPVDALTPWGFLFLSLFMLTVCFLYNRARAPILISVFLGVVLYVVLAETSSRIPLPGFWISCLLVFGLSMAYLSLTAEAHESPRRNPLPLWKKLPVLALTVAVLICTKKQMEGFIMTFPLVTMITMVEARHCLRTVSRQMVYTQPAFLAMLVGIYVTQGHFSRYGSLFSGLLAYGAVLFVLILLAMRKTRQGWKTLQHWDEIL